MTPIKEDNMSNITTEVKIARLQNLRAMERMMVAFGGKEGTIAWLNAMPADAAFANAGSVSHQTLQQIAEDNESYEKAVMAFARHMAPILHDMALGV